MEKVKLPALTEEADALSQIFSAVPAGAPLQLALAEVEGLYAGCDLRAGIPSPPFDCSSMDGYALAQGASSYSKEAVFPLATASAPAGSTPATLERAHALRIFTGAPVPKGTWAVAMQEDVEVVTDGLSIRLKEDYEEGEFIRRAGADLCQGQVLIRKGELLTPQRMAAAASQGQAKLSVHSRPRVGVLTTGDELRLPGEALEPGQIYNSNGALVSALARQAAVQEVTCRHAVDEKQALLQTGRELMEKADFLISCGGVSVGDHDHVRWLVEELGFRTVFWRIRMQPGKPFLFAEHPEGKWFFALPGNPASAFVCFHRFVAPAIRKFLGAADSLWPGVSQPAKLGSPLRGKGDRPHYLRGSLCDGVFRPLGLQQSHAIAGLASSDALVRVPPGALIQEGELVEAWPV